MKDKIAELSMKNLYEEYPYVEGFFSPLGIQYEANNKNVKEMFNEMDDYFFEDIGIGREEIMEHFISFMDSMEEINKGLDQNLKNITIVGGHNKCGNLEDVRVTIRPGEIICIVGHTGSGKSRLLADIEALAQGDTPTGRQILINGEAPDEEVRFSLNNKLVAQLSQNMNFVMDLSVKEFITMHASSRMIENIAQCVEDIVKCANELSGEEFFMETSLTQLSGGQSRALMIADTALLSISPIVLIDEIENAGVDRKKAIELLVKKDKIVLMSTHDPILALMGNKRIVIKNGGISKIIDTDLIEEKNLKTLQSFDNKILMLRNLIRNGEKINFDIKKYFTDLN
ncbi:ABC-type lipoprotein export system, ATPase component [Clostridium acidisoli DSM 12555]|uniref:ABC-type lipoprotein export system, ATPase component n=1 Tax=Clostridium acidisoli DSM 12555 TaxID=1121291 RepID=A0A1W1X7Z4_9CLOT|nr:ATP-binding cassette domain-containing protein [Clostridium acidisoli]SMC19621.1 ABC-type lipoprotein export system, ATPase component [Clostridium acidisoli DSM 12555]